MHSFSAGAHVFTKHYLVKGGGSNQEEQLLYDLIDEALVHAVVHHGGQEDRELLDDGGNGEVLGLLVHAAGALPEACGFHAGNAL